MGRSNRQDARSLLAGAALLAAVVAAYLPALRDGFIWDDDSYVTDNPVLRSSRGLARIWLEPTSVPQWYPLVFTSFWFEYQVWGLAPAGYHLANVLLHAASAVLLWRLLRRLEVPGAWPAAAVFALHPVQVESVAWITERKNALSGLFYLGAFLAYWRFAGGEPASGKGGGGHRRRWYALALLLFAAALLSKTVACSLPAAILLVLWWKREPFRWREALPLLPMFALGAGLAYVTVWLEEHSVGAVGEAWSLSAAERVQVAGRAVWFYAGKLFWPAGLTFNYPRWAVGGGEPVLYLFPTAAALVVAVLWAVRRRIGKGPLVACLFFGGTLLPALGLFNVFPMRYSFVADHFQYLASIGVIVLAVAALRTALSALPRRQRSASRGACAVVLICLAALTWRQTHIYRDLDALWRDTIVKNPDSWLAQNNFGNLLAARGREAAAMAHFNEAIRANPTYHESYSNRGFVHYKRGALDAAIRDFSRAIDRRPRNPQAYFLRGLARARKRARAAAIEDFTKAIDLGIKNPLVHYNRAVTYYETGDYARAWADVEECTRQGGVISPGFLSALSAGSKGVERPTPR